MPIIERCDTCGKEHPTNLPPNPPWKYERAIGGCIITCSECQERKEEDKDV